MTTPVSGITPEHAGRHHQRPGTTRNSVTAVREEEPVVARRAQRDAEAARDDQRVDRRDRQQADDAQLLAERREDEIGVPGRQVPRVAEAESGAEQPPVASAQSDCAI